MRELGADQVSGASYRELVHGILIALVKDGESGSGQKHFETQTLRIF